MIWILSFLIGFLGVALILRHEFLKIKKSDLAFEEIDNKILVPREKVVNLTSDAWCALRLGTHKAIITILKNWVVLTHKTNKYIKDKLAKRPEGEEGGAVSSFLKVVSEYKGKMKKMRERIKQKDE